MMISNRVNRNEEIQFIPGKNYLEILPLDILKAIFANLSYKDSRQANLTNRLISKACRESALDKLFSVQASLKWLTKKATFHIDIKNYLLGFTKTEHIHSYSFNKIYSSTIDLKQCIISALKMCDDKLINYLKKEAFKDGAFHLNNEVFDLAKRYNALDENNSSKNKQQLFSLLRANEYYLRAFEVTKTISFKISEKLFADLVKDFAEIGRMKTAFNITTLIKDFDLLNFALISISRELIKDDCLDDAYLIIEEIDPSLKDIPILEICNGLIKKGEIDKALEVTKLIPEKNRSAVLIKITEELTKKRLIAKALEVVELIPEKLRSFGYFYVCTAYLENNEIQKAFKIALVNLKGDLRNKAVVLVAKAVARKGDSLSAIEAIKRIEFEAVRELALDQVCNEFLENDDLDNALIIAEAMLPSYKQDFILKKITYALIDKNDPDKALFVANKTTSFKDGLLKSVSQSYLRIGKIDMALKVANSIEVITYFGVEPNNYYKTEALESIAEAYIKTRKKTKAFKIAIALPKISNRDLLLHKINQIKTTKISHTLK